MIKAKQHWKQLKADNADEKLIRAAKAAYKTLKKASVGDAVAVVGAKRPRTDTNHNDDDDDDDNNSHKD